MSILKGPIDSESDDWPVGGFNMSDGEMLSFLQGVEANSGTSKSANGKKRQGKGSKAQRKPRFRVNSTPLKMGESGSKASKPAVPVNPSKIITTNEGDGSDSEDSILNSTSCTASQPVSTQTRDANLHEGAVDRLTGRRWIEVL